MSFYNIAMKVLAPVAEVYHRLEVRGAENLPPEGEGFIVAPNHTNWFGWDGIVVSAALKDREARWVSWSYEEKIPFWDAAVRAFGGILYNNRREFPYREVCDEILKKGKVVGIFPEGNNNTVADWYRLRPFLPGCVRMSVMSGAPIVPAAVAGLEEASPILWAKEEEKEPISFLVALPVVFPTKVTVHFGRPVYPGLTERQLDDRAALYAAAREIQLEVLELLKIYRPKARAENSSV